MNDMKDKVDALIWDDHHMTGACSAAVG